MKILCDCNFCAEIEDFIFELTVDEETGDYTFRVTCPDCGETKELEQVSEEEVEDE